MAQPKYVPRDFSAEPGAFGKAATLRWRTPRDEASKARLRAAQLQNLYAYRIRYHATERDAASKPQVDAALKTIAGDVKRRARVAWARGDIELALAQFPAAARGEVRTALSGLEAGTALRQLAARSGFSYVTLMRCLRGETVMHLDLIAWADVVLGDISEVSRRRGG